MIIFSSKKAEPVFEAYKLKITVISQLPRKNAKSSLFFDNLLIERWNKT